MHTQTSAEAAARELARHFEPRHFEPGQILLPGSCQYDAVKVWNSATENRAALVVRPGTAAGVPASVRAARIPLESTAFGIRRDHLVIEIIGAWDPGDWYPARHRVWADQFSAALAPHALPGGYANLLGPRDHEQIMHDYGPNGPRLLAANHRSGSNAPATPSMGSTSKVLRSCASTTCTL